MIIYKLRNPNRAPALASRFETLFQHNAIELAGTRGKHAATFSDPENVRRDYGFSYHPARRLRDF